MDIKWELSKTGAYPKVSKGVLEKTSSINMWKGPVNSPVDEIVKLIGRGDLAAAKHKLRKMYTIKPDQITLTGGYDSFNALVNIVFLEEERQAITRRRLEGN